MIPADAGQSEARRHVMTRQPSSSVRVLSNDEGPIQQRHADDQVYVGSNRSDETASSSEGRRTRKPSLLLRPQASTR